MKSYLAARVVLLSCIVCGISAAVNAQTAVPAQRLVPAIRSAGARGTVIEMVPGAMSSFQRSADGAVIVSGNAAAEAAGSSSTPANPERAKKRKAILGKLTFDRRPSSILKAWSTPPKSDDEEEEVGEDKADKEGTDKEEADTNIKEAGDSEKDKAAEEEPKELTEEEKKAKEAADKAAAEAKEAAEKAKAEAEKLAAEIKQLETDVDALKRNVTLANWADVGGFIASLDEDEGKALYSKLLQSLVTGPPDQPKTRSGTIIGERNVIRATDVMALGELCPAKKLDDSHVASLARLAALCQAEGQAEYIFLDTLKEHVARGSEKDGEKGSEKDGEKGSEKGSEKDGEKQKIGKRTAARILFAANRIDQAKSFLPTVADANKEKDLEALSILTDVYLRLYQRELEKPLLEESWNAAQFLLRAEKADDKQKQKAMQRSVQLVPMLREELGQKWLTESFTSDPQQGMEILAGIGGTSAQSMKTQSRNPSERLATLKLQQTAVDALLAKAPEKAKDWGSTLHLLAANWLREATYSRKYDSTSTRGPSMTRDMYGNYFWSGTSRSSSPPSGMPQPISSGEVLDVMPGVEWMKFLEPGYRSRFSIETARLHLRVKEEAEAFPYIETLAETHKKEATDLVREFLDVWASNHNPNTQSQRTSIYMFSYGYNQRARGIPLTRSRQVRNLEELSGWVKRIRSLPLEDIEDSWISAAFKQVHSSAEVYKLSDMEQVFGTTGQMNAETLAALLQTMRGNLAGIWRKPETQKQGQTNRKQPEIEAEVVRGYETANLLLNQAVSDHPDSWRLQLVKAAIMHDENDYRAELKKTSGFAAARKSALGHFRKAFDLYLARVPELKENEYSVESLQFWFYASLGASDLDQIKQDRQPVLSQIPLIKAALSRLPSETQEKHLSMFANDLFTRMSRVNPGVKFRYVREGLNIVGDHEQAKEARKVFDYYNDLVTEIRLETVLDGSPAVGSEQPFGVYVNLKHTKAIERESGGFAKYLQNQNTGNSYYYNYGRPTENYRDKFEQTARDALDEHFEVLSVTFQPENVASRATEQDGWRTTSYAYILLKARGPEIDRVAPVKLDLDFTDTTGYAVLPVESQALMVDCTTADSDLRPFEELSLTQTLDERQAKDGKLVLEVKAAGQGLMPKLDDLLELKFADFEIDEVEDNGISVSRFDPESNEPVVVSDRLWTLTLKDKSDAAEESREFQFASAKVPVTEEVWQQYDDADLVAVEQTLTLSETYDEPDRTAVFVGFGLGLLLLAGIVAWMFLRKPEQVETAGQRFQVPENATPFNVLSLLKNIESNNGLSSESKQELATSINRIERHFFAQEKETSPPDLRELAQTWVHKAR